MHSHFCSHFLPTPPPQGVARAVQGGWAAALLRALCAEGPTTHIHTYAPTFSPHFLPKVSLELCRAAGRLRCLEHFALRGHDLLHLHDSAIRQVWRKCGYSVGGGWLWGPRRQVYLQCMPTGVTAPYVRCGDSVGERGEDRVCGLRGILNGREDGMANSIQWSCTRA